MNLTFFFLILFSRSSSHSKIQNNNHKPRKKSKKQAAKETVPQFNLIEPTTGWRAPSPGDRRRLKFMQNRLLGNISSFDTSNPPSSVDSSSYLGSAELSVNNQQSSSPKRK